MINISVKPQNIESGNISVDSSLNVNGENNHFKWLVNPGDEEITITRGKEITVCKACEIVANLNKLLKPFNHHQRGISTYCIKVSDIQKLPSSRIINAF